MSSELAPVVATGVAVGNCATADTGENEQVNRTAAGQTKLRTDLGSNSFMAPIPKRLARTKKTKKLKCREGLAETPGRVQLAEKVVLQMGLQRQTGLKGAANYDAIGQQSVRQVF